MVGDEVPLAALYPERKRWGKSWLEMLDWVREVSEFSARALEIVGIGTIVLGVLAGIVMFVRNVRRAVPFQISYKQYRRDLGRAILLGLEYLVGADIIAHWRSNPATGMSACWR